MNHKISFEMEVGYNNKVSVEVEVEAPITEEDQAVIAGAIESIRVTMAPYLQEKQEALAKKVKPQP
jgi:hypothetical protein